MDGSVVNNQGDRWQVLQGSGCSPYKWPKLLINGGDPNHLQVLSWSSKYCPFTNWDDAPAAPFTKMALKMALKKSTTHIHLGVHRWSSKHSLNSQKETTVARFRRLLQSTRGISTAVCRRRIGVASSFFRGDLRGHQYHQCLGNMGFTWLDLLVCCLKRRKIKK